MINFSRREVILKVRLGDDIRRMVLYNTYISYDDFLLMLERVYDGKLKSSDNVTLKYYDEDNDLITIAGDWDFANARKYAQRGIVKMVVYVNGQDKFVDTKQPLGIRKELTEVRDKVLSLVDALESGRAVVDHASTTAANDLVPQDGNSRWTVKDDQKIPPQAASMLDPLATSSPQTLSVAEQIEAGMSHTFGSSQNGTALLSQTSNQAESLSSQSQSGSHYSQLQTITTAPTPPPSSSSYPAAQTGQPCYPTSQAQTGSQQPHSTYTAQPLAPRAATDLMSNPTLYSTTTPNTYQYPPVQAPNLSGSTKGPYPQPEQGTASSSHGRLPIHLRAPTTTQNSSQCQEGTLCSSIQNRRKLAKCVRSSRSHSTYTAQPLTPRAGTDLMSNPTLYSTNTPNTCQYPQVPAPNLSGSAKGSYPQPEPGKVPYLASYGRVPFHLRAPPTAQNSGHCQEGTLSSSIQN